MDDSIQTTFRAGDVVDRKWVILKLVGQGGMAEVYQAYQLKLERQVAGLDNGCSVTVAGRILSHT
ncbi:MAG: hypothetical protein P4L55_06755 [Syntrophobacteraceae bacterium]|nr:hypothetical protein [Syntrophobacteraceae bacterium]